MKKDLAEVKAMADSNRARDTYVNKEQDKFFCCLNRQQVDIDTLKDQMKRSELRARALELENECQGVTPSNSKGGLPAPEAGARAQRGNDCKLSKLSKQSERLARHSRVKRRARPRRPH